MAQRREPIAPTSNPPYFPSTGTPTAIVILVEFQDTKFTVSDPKTVFDQYLNGDEQTEMGYGESLNHGSVKKYFTDMSFGAYKPTFDIVGPVTLSKTCHIMGKQRLGKGCQLRRNDKGGLHSGIRTDRFLNTQI